MAMAELDWGALEASIDGSVVLPETPGYDDARRPAIVNFHDIRPQAVVRCRTATDVAETLRFAALVGLPLAVRGGGHCFAGRSSTGGIVLDTTPMSSVTLSGDVATVGAGCRLGPLYDALAESAVTIPAGCGPDVGVAGLTLGGGLGILGRAHGLTSDRLSSAEVVLADGRQVTCDDRRYPDLFWALRGAGGARFGVVISLTFRTVRAPTLTSFHLSWPYSLAARVIGEWQAWAPDGPDELAASLHVRATGPTTEPPKVHVFGTLMDGDSNLARQLDVLVDRIGVEPDGSTRHTVDYRESKRLLAKLFPGDEGQVFSKSEYFDRLLTADAIAELLTRITDGRRPGESRILDFMPWGGAYGRPRPDATAFAHRQARFLLKHEAVVASSGRDTARDWLAGSWSVVHPLGTGGVYPNFPDPDLDYWSPAYHGANLDRLRRVKAEYDPTGVFGP
jgi:FAD/FMN-containing dehydrogenase